MLTSTSTPVMRTTSVMTSTGAIPAKWRNRSNSRANNAQRCRPSGLKSASPGSMTASSRETNSTASADATASSNVCVKWSSCSTTFWSPDCSRTRSCARRLSAKRSAGPKRQRGPDSKRTSEGFSQGSSRSFNVAITSAISGSSRRPPIPTTSTLIPCATSALYQRATCELARSKIAIS